MGDYGGYNNQQSYTTSYGAQGGAHGGGFMQSGSQENSGAANKGYGKDTLRPVTIKQINDAVLPHPDADFRIDNVDITQVTFVGQIRNISTQATNHTYKLDDGTGTIEVKQWIDPDAFADSAGDGDGGGSNGNDGKQRLTENAYARVWGRLKAFNNKRHVGAHVIRPVTDLNEVQYHMLEATAVHLHVLRGGPPSERNKAAAGAADGNANGYGARQQNGDNNNSNGAGGRQLPAGLSGAARRVYGCLNSGGGGNEGLHMQDIAARLGLEMSDVAKAGDELLGSGLIYTTVDDSTWCVLDGI